MTDYTPSLEEVRDATSLFRSRFFDKDEFDRWYQAEVAAAEERGAERVLRETADHIAATDHYMIDGDKYTPCSSCKSIHYQYLDYLADQMEGDDD